MIVLCTYFVILLKRDRVSGPVLAIGLLLVGMPLVCVRLAYLVSFPFLRGLMSDKKCLTRISLKKAHNSPTSVLQAIQTAKTVRPAGSAAGARSISKRFVPPAFIRSLAGLRSCRACNESDWLCVLACTTRRCSFKSSCYAPAPPLSLVHPARYAESIESIHKTSFFSHQLSFF